MPRTKNKELITDSFVITLKHRDYLRAEANKRRTLDSAASMSSVLREAIDDKMKKGKK